MKRWWVLGLRLLLGGIFLYASWDKILYPKEFAETIYNYRLLPDFLINFSALVLPWLELFLGICILSGLWLPGAVFLINLLMAIFFGALIFNLARGWNVQCGCFGIGGGGAVQEGTILWYVLLDLLFLFCGITLLVFVYRRDRIDEDSLGHG